VSYQDLKPANTIKVQSSKKSSITANSQANTLIKPFDIENEVSEPDVLD
jgi:hypothetical protein